MSVEIYLWYNCLIKQLLNHKKGGWRPINNNIQRIDWRTVSFYDRFCNKTHFTHEINNVIKTKEKVGDQLTSFLTLLRIKGFMMSLAWEIRSLSKGLCSSWDFWCTTDNVKNRDAENKLIKQRIPRTRAKVQLSAVQNYTWHSFHLSKTSQTV